MNGKRCRTIVILNASSHMIGSHPVCDYTYNVLYLYSYIVHSEHSVQLPSIIAISCGNFVQSQCSTNCRSESWRWFHFIRILIASMWTNFSLNCWLNSFECENSILNYYRVKQAHYLFNRLWNRKNECYHKFCSRFRIFEMAKLSIEFKEFYRV